MDVKNIKRAIVSVSDKTGVVDFVKALKERGVEILSTGGTAKLLAENGIDVTKVSDFTGFPEILDGRVKTLHPKIHGGILARRSDEKHLAQMKEHGIEPIDMVVINLYPFEATVAKEGVSEQEAIENIDIGGPSMIRSAAKNFSDVTVVTDPGDYAELIAELKKKNGLTLAKRRTLSIKAFGRTAEYDAAIHSHFSGGGETDSLRLDYKKVQEMRYGENPHQSAAFYAKSGDVVYTGGNQLHGKELSYNNIVDVAAALELAREFDTPCAVIIKHTNPCGAAIDDDQTKAYRKALACDPSSAFGGVLSFNRPVTAATAKEISKLFTEAIIAPDFDKEALAILTKKKNIRLIKPENFNIKEDRVIKSVPGGLLVQGSDNITLDETKLRVVSKRQPTPQEMEAMKFAWKVAKHVKSNSIVYARDGVTVGVGAGQMSRVDSSKIAVLKALSPLKGCVMSSDAFFPFRDGIDAAGKEGITAVISPGGSVRDEDIIKAGDEYDMALVFTGIRHFRH